MFATPAAYIGFTIVLATSIIAAPLVRSTLRPPTYRPIFFIVGGIFFLAFSFLASSIGANFLSDGLVDIESRRFGRIMASREATPLEFWIAILLAYTSSILFATYGLALSLIHI